MTAFLQPGGETRILCPSGLHVSLLQSRALGSEQDHDNRGSTAWCISCLDVFVLTGYFCTEPTAILSIHSPIWANSLLTRASRSSMTTSLSLRSFKRSLMDVICSETSSLGISQCSYLCLAQVCSCPQCHCRLPITSI